MLVYKHINRSTKRWWINEWKGWLEGVAVLCAMSCYYLLLSARWIWDLQHRHRPKVVYVALLVILRRHASKTAAAAGLPLTLFWHCPTARVQLQAHLAHLNCAQIGPFFALRTDRPITSSSSTDCWRLELRAVSRVGTYLLSMQTSGLTLSRAAGRPGIGPVRSGCVAIL